MVGPREGLSDQGRADHGAVVQDQAAVRLMTEYRLANPIDQGRIEAAGDRGQDHQTEDRRPGLSGDVYNERRAGLGEGSIGLDVRLARHEFGFKGGIGIRRPIGLIVRAPDPVRN
jgi:hypothetical protein